VSWLKFRHAVQQAVRRANEEKRKLSLTFVRDGETVKTKDAAKDPTLMDRGSFFERKLVNVKATHGKNPERCEW
jgi:hypothetical protein